MVVEVLQQVNVQFHPQVYPGSLSRRLTTQKTIATETSTNKPVVVF
jgi:hypothetical protein